MSINVSQLPEDNVANARDLIVITDKTTGDTMNLPVEKIMEFYQASGTSIVTTNNILSVTETPTEDWLDVMNAAVIPWTIGTGDVAHVYRYDKDSNYVGTYLYIKSSTSVVRIGQGETQVTLGSFIIVRDTDDVGEVNTMSSFGAGVALLKSKTGADFVMQSIKAGVRGTMSVTIEADGIHIDTVGDLGEVNTLGNAGTGVSLVSTKVGDELKVKGLKGSYVDVGTSGDDVTITGWGKITRTGSFTVSATDSQRTIQIDNGASAVVVTVPATLGVDFEDVISTTRNWRGKLRWKWSYNHRDSK